MMDYDSKIFVYQFPLVKRFVYHLIYYRVVNQAYLESGLKNEFWTLTANAHLLHATINWCMVFGSDKSNETHWKRLSKNKSEEFYQSFRDGLFQDTGLDSKQWAEYWKRMTDFRNKYAAHREIEDKSLAPYFDTALAVAYFYDKWVREVISPASFKEPALERFAVSLRSSVTPLINQLLQTTIELENSA